MGLDWDCELIADALKCYQPGNKFSSPGLFMPFPCILCPCLEVHSQKEKLKLCMFSTYIEIFMFCT